jgi:hypothetical protein
MNMMYYINMTEQVPFYIWGTWALPFSWPMPMKEGELKSVYDISLGDSFAIIIDSTKSLWAWGYSQLGCLGLGKGQFQAKQPTRIRIQGVIPGQTNFKKVSVGKNHVIAITESGEIYSWGGNDFGQLGVARSVDTCLWSPTQIYTENSKAKDVFCTENSSFIITEDTKVYSFGQNNFGQLGLRSTMDFDAPRRINELGFDNIKKIVTRGNQIVAIKNLDNDLSDSDYEASGVGLDILALSEPKVSNMEEEEDKQSDKSQQQSFISKSAASIGKAGNLNKSSRSISKLGSHVSKRSMLSQEIAKLNADLEQLFKDIENMQKDLEILDDKLLENIYAKEKNLEVKKIRMAEFTNSMISIKEEAVRIFSNLPETFSNDRKLKVFKNVLIKLIQDSISLRCLNVISSKAMEYESKLKKKNFSTIIEALSSQRLFADSQEVLEASMYISKKVSVKIRTNEEKMRSMAGGLSSISINSLRYVVNSMDTISTLWGAVNKFTKESYGKFDTEIRLKNEESKS